MSTPALARATAPSLFTWTFPGAPICVKIPYELISRLRAEIDDHVSLDQKSGAERGGVLIGHQEGAGTLRIDDFVWVTPEQQSGKYNTDQSQFEVVRKVYTTPVGYFRTQSEETLRLRDEEIHFFQQQFPHPTNVALLVNTSRRPYKAGFFFWMKENELSPFSFLDFTLDEKAARLEFFEPEELPAKALERAVSKEPEKPVAEKHTLERPSAERPAAEKSATRKGGMELPPAAELSEPHPKAVESSSSRVVDDPRFPPTSIVKVWKLQPAVSIAGSFQPEPFELKKPLPPGIEQKAKKPEAGKKELISEHALIAAIFFTVLVMTGVYTYLRNQPVHARPPAFPMQLSVEARGGGLNIWWNPQSAAIVQARQGRMMILEEPQKTETIPLDEKQLASGHLYYRSSGERIQLQLEITDRSGNVSKESVFTVSSKVRR